MTITITLSPEEEARLRQRATESGEDVNRFLHTLIQRELQEEGALHAGMTFEQILAPVHEYSRRMGYTEEDLDEVFEQARNEVYREQDRLPSKDEPPR